MNRQALLHSQHQHVQLLLPWYLKQTLEPVEHQQVETHLRECNFCRHELLNLRKLAAAVQQTTEMDTAAEISFAALRARLPVKETAQQTATQSGNGQIIAWPDKQASVGLDRPKQYKHRPRRLLGLPITTDKRLALVASVLLALIPLSMNFSRSPTTADYYTLSATKPTSQTGAQLLVVFAKSLPSAEINKVLSSLRSQTIEGPNSVGAYTVSLAASKDSSDVTTAVALLRNRSDVVLVEPISQP